MCLAVPGKVVAWLEREFPFCAASVDFSGVRRRVNMACVPEASEGDFVLVHAGIAISRIDSEEADRLLAALDEIEEIEQNLTE